MQDLIAKAISDLDKSFKLKSLGSVSFFLGFEATEMTKAYGQRLCTWGRLLIKVKPIRFFKFFTMVLCWSAVGGHAMMPDFPWFARVPGLL